MAKQTVVQLVDDVDGKALTDAVTIRFGIDGKSYEFDTSSTHAKEFHKIVDKYVEVSRRVSAVGRTKAAVAVGGSRPKEQTAAIRDWARRNGYDVNERGRIPGEIIAAFEAAH